MILFGLNAYHGDSSACIVKDGYLIAAAEEERFNRIKHWAGLPVRAIAYCLEEAGIGIQDIDHIAINRDPHANLFNKMIFTVRNIPSFEKIKSRLDNANKIKDIRVEIANAFGLSDKKLKAKLHNVEHHIAHLASSYLVSPFNSASLLSVDGFGDFVSTMSGTGEGTTISVIDKVNFPHSLGVFYLALTQFLGFPKYGDEYKVMGLAAFGKPLYMDKMRKIVTPAENGFFKLNLEYFIHHVSNTGLMWNDGEPEVGVAYSEMMIEEFGLPRRSDEAITEHHKNIAASLQTMYEEIFFNILNRLYQKTRNPVLCLSGGCAMNSVANGKIFGKTPFKDVYVQSAAGDAGGAIGAAYYVYNHSLNRKRVFEMNHSYWGPHYDSESISHEIQLLNNELSKDNCVIERSSGPDALCSLTAKYIAEGKVVGWFQGRTEWGPRALGNRSILADPRRNDMRGIINSRIKKRESFRPFAPSVLDDAVSDYFEEVYPDPFMLKVYKIKPEKRETVPAVTHCDGTGRLQTVNEKNNPLYWKLIKEFEKLTNVPMILNTSFNENEPIVNTPKEALDCFLRTEMDVLVLGDYVIRRSGNSL